MELFESELLDEKQTAMTVEPEPRYQPVATASLPTEANEHGHAWIRTIGLILLGLVLVIIIVLLARWAYHHVHHSSKTGSSSTSTSAGLSGDADKLAAGSDSSLQNSSPSAPNNSSAGRTATPPPAGSTKITNTGPGNVVGLFVASSLAAAGLHYIISLRRFNRA